MQHTSIKNPHHLLLATVNSSTCSARKMAAHCHHPAAPLPRPEGQQCPSAPFPASPHKHAMRAEQTLLSWWHELNNVNPAAIGQPCNRKLMLLPGITVQEQHALALAQVVCYISFNGRLKSNLLHENFKIKQTAWNPHVDAYSTLELSRACQRTWEQTIFTPSLGSHSAINPIITYK